MIPKRNIIRNLKKAIAEPGYAVGVFKKRLGSYLSYRSGLGRSAYPETISLFLTHQCNLRCKMCGQWGEAGSSRNYTPETLRERLSVEELEALINDLAVFKPNVTLFGGEPMLYPQWTEVVRMIKARGMRCNMITNAVLLEARAEAIIDSGLDEVIFSLDGPRDIHDEIRGAAGTYDRAMSGFKKLVQLKDRRGLKAPLINISSAIFELNYTRMEETVRAASAMGADSITFHHLIFTGRDVYERHNDLFRDAFSCSSTDWQGFVRDKLPDIDPEALLQRMKELKASARHMDISFYPNLTDKEVRAYYGGFEFAPSSYEDRCLSPWMVAYIFPDGSVKPCQSLNHAIGNIKTASFLSIWNNESARHFRNVLKRERRFPVCSRCTEFYRY